MVVKTECHCLVLFTSYRIYVFYTNKLQLAIVTVNQTEIIFQGYRYLMFSLQHTECHNFHFAILLDILLHVQTCNNFQITIQQSKQTVLLFLFIHQRLKNPDQTVLLLNLVLRVTTQSRNVPFGNCNPPPTYRSSRRPCL